MLNSTALKDLLHGGDLSRQDKILLCLALAPLAPRTVAEIKNIGVGAGLKKIKGWNVSEYLGRTSGLAIRVPQGWELTSAGKSHVSALAGPYVETPAIKAALSLRSHLSSISNPQTQVFVEEAIRCLESKLLRAAIVLSWVGAISLLYDFVVAQKLSEFNAEANKRDTKWKDAKTSDDLSNIKEFTFLEICCAISVFGKNVKTELEGCLKLRNGCGHPNSLKIGEHKAEAHVEVLILNVFTIY